MCPVLFHDQWEKKKQTDINLHSGGADTKSGERQADRRIRAGGNVVANRLEKGCTWDLGPDCLRLNLGSTTYKLLGK